ncbi:MAG: hypothetical protein JRG91_16525, partial [Deltaproteobacteria bacterium]|nr:hypothetical protein [Deltaproteobacteria bacterium]
MKKGMRDPRACLFVIAALLAPLPVQARSLTNEELKRLESGQQVMILLDDDPEYVGGSSHILIEDDIKTAWTVVQDPAIFEKLYPSVLESKIVSRTDGATTIKMVHGNKLVKAVCYVSYRTNAKKHRLSWRLDKSRKSDITETRGSIRFSQYQDGRTLITMTTLLGIGNEFI